MEGLASGLETLFSRVREGTLALDQRMTRVIHQVLDASEECVGAFRENRIPEQPAAALRAMEELLGSRASRAGRAGRIRLRRPARAREPTPAPAAVSQPAEMVRLPAENLDRLVRSTGQILTESLRQASVTAELDALDGQIAEMAAECVRFRKASAAPLWRLASQPEYASVIRHIGFIEQKVRSLAAQSRAARLLQQRSAWNTRRSAEQLQRDVWSARMAPAEDLFEGFRKMVRDLAAEENKEIDFRLSGSGVRADRIVLQALKDPVMHLLRNAISHGIETPRRAREQGKIAGGFADPASGLPTRTPDRGGGRRRPGRGPEESGQGAFPGRAGRALPGRAGASHLSARAFPLPPPSTTCPGGAWDSRWFTKRCTASRATWI